MNLSYSFYITTLKKFLFLVSFILFLSIFFNKSSNIYVNSSLENELNLTDGEQVVINPKYIGIDKKQRPFTIRAAKAKKIDPKVELFNLSKPSGEIKNKKGESIYLKSLEGEFDQTNQKVHLYKNVELKNLRGLSFKTESAHIDLKTNIISGNKKVFGQNKKGKISSEGFEITDEGEKIFFKGKSNLKLIK